MTSNSDVVRAWLREPIRDVAARGAYLAEGFQNVDTDGTVLMDKATWNGMYHMLLGSFKDWDYVVSEVRDEGDSVIMSGHFEGTHTADLDLSAMGLGVVKASGKKHVWPEATSKITIEGEKIVRMEPYGDAGRGMEAFLAELGVKRPSA